MQVQVQVGLLAESILQLAWSSLWSTRALRPGSAPLLEGRSSDNEPMLLLSGHRSVQRPLADSTLIKESGNLISYKST